MQQWLNKAVVILLDGGGTTSTGTLVSYDDLTITVQETAGVHTYARSRFHDCVAGA